MPSYILRFIILISLIATFITPNIYSAEKKDIKEPGKKNADKPTTQNKNTEPEPGRDLPDYPSRTAEPVEEEKKDNKKLSEIKRIQDYLKDKEKRTGGKLNFNIRTIAGHYVMNKLSYLYFRLQPAIKYKHFMLALDLNLEVHASDYYESPYPAHDAGDIRNEEWTKAAAYPGKILFLVLGDEYETPIFFHIGRLHDYTLGNGFIVYRYNNNLYSPDMKKSGAEFKADFDWIGVEGFTSDIIDLDLFGGRFILRPFGLTDYKNSIIGKAEISYVFVAETDVYDKDRHNNESYALYDGNEKILAHSLDVRVPFLRSKGISMSGYYSYGNIVSKGSGHSFGITGDIAQGFVFYAFEFRIINKGYMAPIVTMQWDVQKKLSYWGSNANSSYMDHLNNAGQGYSIFFEFKNSWLKRKIGFFMTFEMFIGGEIKAKPHFQFGFFMKQGVLSDRVAMRFVVDKVQMDSNNVLNITDMYTFFTIETSVVITSHVEMAIIYIKSFTEDFDGVPMENEVFMFETRITF